MFGRCKMYTRPRSRSDALTMSKMAIKSFTLVKPGRRRQRRLDRPSANSLPPKPPATDPAAASAAAAAALAEYAKDDPAKEEMRDEKAIEKIEDHLLKMFRQEAKMPVAQLVTDSKTPRPIAFKIEMLPEYFRIDGLSLALPYSADNQRFLQMLETNRLPWDHLRAVPGLKEMCEGKYANGGLTVEVEDKRVGEHCYDTGVRHVQVQMDDDALLQDLQAAYMDSVNESLMSDDPNAQPWSADFKLKLESLILSHISPAPCLYPSLAVGRLCNMLQFNRLKLNNRRLRTLTMDFVPLPLKRPRFAPATYGSWVRSSHGQPGQPGGPFHPSSADGSNAGGPTSGKRVRKPTAAALENMQGKGQVPFNGVDPMFGAAAAAGGMGMGMSGDDPYARPYLNGKGPRGMPGQQGKGARQVQGMGAGGKAGAQGAAGRKRNADGLALGPPPDEVTPLAPTSSCSLNYPCYRYASSRISCKSCRVARTRSIGSRMSRGGIVGEARRHTTIRPIWKCGANRPNRRIYCLPTCRCRLTARMIRSMSQRR